MDTQDKIIETLNHAESLYDLVRRSKEILTQRIEALILALFTQENHARQFVIPSLMENEAPLHDVFMQLKLLYVLGRISKTQYDDCFYLFYCISVDTELNHQDIFSLLTQLQSIAPFVKQNIVAQSMESFITPEQFPNSIYTQRQNKISQANYILAFTQFIIQLSGKQ